MNEVGEEVQGANYLYDTQCSPNIKQTEAMMLKDQKQTYFTSDSQGRASGQ